MKTKLGVLNSVILAAFLAVPHAGVQAASTPTTVPAAKAQLHSRYTPNHSPKKASEYYSLVWGVDSLSVRAVESGSLIRFSYRIVDPAKAALFNNKKIEAFLDAPVYRIRLVVPSLEKVGQLRQVNSPQEGLSYWMAFSNPRRTVKRGDRVNVVIGNFRADGLTVE
jgi:hypothetical protein